MRLLDYLSCLPNYETKWYSYSTDSIILSVSSPGSEGRLRAPRSARSGHFLRSFHLQGSNPWPRYTQHPPIMDTSELFFEARDSRRYIERDRVCTENWKSRYARLCLLKFFKTCSANSPRNSVHCHHQSPDGEEVQAVLHCFDMTRLTESPEEILQDEKSCD